MDSNTKHFSSVSKECSSEDSSQNEISEDEILHISPTIRRCRIESDAEDETDIANENQHSNNIDNNEWSNSITRTAASISPFVKSRTAIQIEVSEFRMILIMHLTQCHSPEPSNILIRRRLRHEMQKKEGRAYLTRKFCKKCYKKNVKLLGSKIAKSQTKKVTTYCLDCIDQPHLCLKCFTTVHR
ncbi:hypothetical protein ANTPLA_LOCUS7958 [Anthophora plagiata]